MHKITRRSALFFLAVTAASGLFSSCSKDPLDGIITASVNISCLPESTPLSSSAGHRSEYIINDDSSYLQTFGTSCSLPAIDFNTYTLLGLDASTGGCSARFIRKVTIHSSENKYHYKVTAKGSGMCKMLIMSYNWVLVPKLPGGWTVTFEAIEK